LEILAKVTGHGSRRGTGTLAEHVGTQENGVGEAWRKLGVGQEHGITVEVRGLAREVVQGVIQEEGALEELLGLGSLLAVCEQRGLIEARKAFEFLLAGLSGNLASELEGLQRGIGLIGAKLAIGEFQRSSDEFGGWRAICGSLPGDQFQIFLILREGV